MLAVRQAMATRMQGSGPLWVFVLLGAIWLGFIVMLERQMHRQHLAGVERIALSKAEADFETTLYYRHWNARHGGVYGRVSEQTPPNPYLEPHGREIRHPDGSVLTLINPAYMTRQVHEAMALDGRNMGRMTSLQPINPNNAPSEWERQALQRFEAGAPRYVDLAQEPGVGEVLRYMKPFVVEASCMACHAQQGYRIGDIRGGLSVVVPTAPIHAELEDWHTAMRRGLWATAGIGLCVFGGFGWVNQRHFVQEKALRYHYNEARENLQRVAENMPGVVFKLVRDTEGRYSVPFINEKVRDYFGCGPEALREGIEAGMAALEEPERRATYIALDASFMLGQPWTQTLKIGEGETARWLQVGANINQRADGGAEWYGYITDVTEQKTLEAHLRAAREAAEASGKVKDDFLAMMSHEIRTPLNGILPCLDLLKAAETDSKRIELLGFVSQNASRLLRLLSDILEYTRYRSGKMVTRPSDYAPEAVLAACLRTHEEDAQAKGLKFWVRNGLETGAMHSSDRLLLTRALDILLTNAVKFTQRGEIILEVAWRREGRALEYRVRDTGPGIDAAFLETLFDPFAQADMSLTRMHEGSGLGLAICKLIVEGLGGILEVDSDARHGTEIRIVLPA